MEDLQASKNILSNIDDYLSVTSEIIASAATKISQEKKQQNKRELEFNPNNTEEFN